MRAEALAEPLAEAAEAYAANPQKTLRKAAEGLRKRNPPNPPVRVRTPRGAHPRVAKSVPTGERK